MSVTEIELINTAEAYAREEQRAERFKDMHKGVKSLIPDTIIDVGGKITDLLS